MTMLNTYYRQDLLRRPLFVRTRSPDIGRQPPSRRPPRHQPPGPRHGLATRLARAGPSVRPGNQRHRSVPQSSVAT